MRRNAEKIAATNLEVAEQQYALTKAGAWIYDIQNQEKQYTPVEGLCARPPRCSPSTRSGRPADGVVRSMQAAVGSYVSPQGAYDTYTQGMNPLIVMGAPDDHLQVRVYVDEILVHRLADPPRSSARCSSAAPTRMCR